MDKNYDVHKSGNPPVYEIYLTKNGRIFDRIEINKKNKPLLDKLISANGKKENWL